MRLALYGSVSSLLTFGVVISAVHENPSFYSVWAHLSNSNACMMILLNMGLIVTLLFGKALQLLFFGKLRVVEIENLYERSWYAITETCLAMTVFREDFDLHFTISFVTLLFLKTFHWLCQDRIEFMEQIPTTRVSFHLRIILLFAILLFADSFSVVQAVKAVLSKGTNITVIFVLEYIILIYCIISTIGKYTLNMIELLSEENWEKKSIFDFSLDITTAFFKLVTYFIFITYLCFKRQIPLHILRDTYATVKSFIEKYKGLRRHHMATRSMNDLYPNATIDDINQLSDSTCIICREDMHDSDLAEGDSPEIENLKKESDQAKKLPCGHIFHFRCLRGWLERQQTCPTCRRSAINNKMNINENLNQIFSQSQQDGTLNNPTQNDIPYWDSFYSDEDEDYSSGIAMLSNQTGLSHINNNDSSVITNTQIQSQNTNTVDSTPLNLPDRDFQTIPSLSRESIGQRLRSLNGVQSQLNVSMHTLSRVLSVVDPVGYTSIDSNTNNRIINQENSLDKSNPS